MKKRTMIYMKEVAKVMPFVLLVADCFSLFFYQFDWYNDQFYYLFTQFTGHGLMLLIGYAFFAHYNRLCLYTIISIYGLLALNVFNIIYQTTNIFNSYYLYVSIILIVSLCLSIIFLIKKK
jgi:hypothetical protein